MKRYFNSFMGMTESEKGEWIQYSIFEAERDHALLNEDLADSRMVTIQERNTELILLNQELNTLRTSYNKHLDIFDGLKVKFDLFVGSIALNIVCLMVIIFCFMK